MSIHFDTAQVTDKKRIDHDGESFNRNRKNAVKQNAVQFTYEASKISKRTIIRNAQSDDSGRISSNLKVVVEDDGVSSNTL